MNPTTYVRTETGGSDAASTRVGRPLDRIRRLTRAVAPAGPPVRPPAREKRPAAPAVGWLTSASAMLGLVCLWAVLQMLVLGGLSQGRAQQQLYDGFRTELASATAPVGPDRAGR